MYKFLLLVMLCVTTSIVPAIKDEKDLLKAVEHLTGEPLLGFIVRDPFSWPAQKISKQRIVAKAQKVRAAPTLLWSLTGVSKTKRGLYALIGDGKNTKLARIDEQLGNGWSISSITPQGVVCKHSSGVTRELHV